MYQFKIFNSLNKMFQYPHVGRGAGGSAIGDNSATAIAGDGGFQPTGDNIEEEFIAHQMANDEEYQEILKEMGNPGEGDDGTGKEGGKGDKSKKDGEDKEGGEGEESGSEDGEGEGDEGGEGEDGDKKGASASQDDDLPPADPKEGDNWLDENDNEYTFKEGKWIGDDGQEFKKTEKQEGGEGAEGEEGASGEEDEFIDDVIPGLKGQHFKALPAEAQESIAKYHQDNVNYRAAAKADLEIMKAVKNDPIAKHRIELIKAGRGNDLYEVPEVTKDEAQKILDAADAETATKLINSTVMRIARTARDNERLRDEAARKVKESNETGERILREAGNLHPDLFNEKKKVDRRLKDFENTETVGHGDKDIYDNYHQKIVDFCAQRGYKYSDIAKIKPNELYALVAVNEGWPVAFNTQKRDTQMLTEHTKKALSHFVRSKRGREVARGMRTVENQRGDSGIIAPYKVQGIDIVKLAKDDGYHESVLNMRPGSTDWIDRVRELRDQGEKIIDRRQKKRKQAESRKSG